MANRWGNNGNSDRLFLGSRITADGDCSYEIKTCLLLGRKAMTNLDSILKSRDITLPTKVHLVKSLVFPVVMYGCERWTIKKAECWRSDAFKLWCWRRFLRVPWTARRSNQSILKEINPEYSLEGLMLKLNSNTLATWWEKLTYLKGPWCEKDIRQEEKGTTEDGIVGWHQRLDGTWVWVNSRSWCWTRRPGVLQFMGSQTVGHNLETEQKQGEKFLHFGVFSLSKQGGVKWYLSYKYPGFTLLQVPPGRCRWTLKPVLHLPISCEARCNWFSVPKSKW